MRDELQTVGERDEWRCWICTQDVDPNAPRGTPGAPSVDHVIPRSRGGSSEAENLRLAHRRCNMRRSDHLPELEWPSRYHLSLQVPLWEALNSRSRRPGEWQIVALATQTEAPEVQEWLEEHIELVDTYQVRQTERGALTALEVRSPPEGGVKQPRAGRERRQSRTR